jgi:Tfp pilus assembly protein PilV
MSLRARAGFTLVELMVAVLLIDVGLLALVAGSAIVVRRQTEIRIRTAAARAAANRLELLAAGPCANESGSASVERGISESWSASFSGGSRDLADSVVFALSGVEHHVVLRTRAPC